jgi:hypothetical protein
MCVQLFSGFTNGLFTHVHLVQCGAADGLFTCKCLGHNALLSELGAMFDLHQGIGYALLVGGQGGLRAQGNGGGLGSQHVGSHRGELTRQVHGERDGGLIKPSFLLDECLKSTLQVFLSFGLARWHSRSMAATTGRPLGLFQL